MDTNNYRRKAVINRPWLTGGLYDLLTRPTILHLDARVLYVDDFKAPVLVLDWRQGGKARVALDAYLIEPDGLTPLWDAERVARVGGSPLYWSHVNRDTFAPLHVSVLAMAAEAEQSGRWARVSTVCHYVYASDRDPWEGLRRFDTSRT